MTRNQHLAHIVSVVVTAVAAVLTPALMPGGALAAYSWAPLALASVAYLARLASKLGGPPAAAVLVLLAVPLLGGATCIKTPVGPTPPADAGPSFVNCSDAAIHQAALNILPSVENALASASYEAALASVIAGVGGPLAFAEVACAVQWIESKAEANVTTTADSLEATKAGHAKAWLAAHAVTFQ